MKKLKIYIDTSVIGGCFDEEFYLWSNGLFEDFKKSIFTPIISVVTSYEILGAPDKIKKKYAELISYGAVELEITDEINDLADLYIKRKIITKKFRDDARHIALATVNNIDVAVSWNFKHIVHYDKIIMFNGVNQETGYKAIQIYSPREVTSYGKDI